MSLSMANHRKYIPYVIPASVLSLILVVLPLLGLLTLSFWKLNLTEGRLPSFAGIDNYVRMLHDRAFLHSFWITAFFTLECVVLQVGLGMGIALLFNRPWPGMGLIRAMFLTPMMIAPLFAGTTWRLMYSDDFGIVKYLLRAVGVETPPLWLADPTYALQSVIVVNVWEWTSFVVLFLLAGLQSIPPQLYEAAALEGCGRVRLFWKITLPLLRPVLLTVVLFRAIDSFKVFDVIYAMTGGGPGQSTEVMSYKVYQYGIKFFELGYSSTLAVVVLGIVMMMAWSLLRLRGRLP